MKVELPLGDVVDRITILRLKVERIGSAPGRAHAARELARLESAWAEAGHPPVEALAPSGRLFAVNAALWEVEDRLREHEAREDFGEDFVRLARSVYRLNDERAALKRAINDLLGSELVEVKGYAAYP